ncbi:MAG: glycogen synthase [Ardenticatenia bacterium]|nr:glycogen synthase [Ardenticatenia bacterium]
MKILLLAAEVVPFVKTGGLADVTGSLPPAIRELGHDIRVAMPRYGRIRPDRFPITPVPGSFPVPMDSHTEPAELMQATLGNDVPVYLVENAHYFDRDGIYMYPDDAERFVFFCRGAMEGMRHLGCPPAVIPCHAWHTALVPNWLTTVYANDPFFADTASVYPIHSLGYRGIFGHRVLEIAGIAEYEFVARPEGTDANQVVDFMSRGIGYADVINTVSPTYAREILTPEYGEQMDSLLRSRRERLFGILNGIDVDEFNPAADPHLDTSYTVETLDLRPRDKLALQQETGLHQDVQTPVVGIIARLVDQKGFDLIAPMVEPMLQHLGIQFVLLGTGEQRYHEFFLDLARRYPHQAGVFLTFNASLSHRIYAGADIFLMPSRFEPCGLGQMIAMRYGSVPLVRAVGGLADTVSDYDPATDQGTGFVFESYEAMSLYTTMVRAVETYRHREIWRRLQARCMQQDFSWQTSAKKYAELYARASRLRAQERPDSPGQAGE